MPASFRQVIKRCTSAPFRRQVRRLLGAGFDAIPDQIITVPGGRKFHIGPDAIYWPLYMGQEFEPDATSVIRRLVRPGDHIVDAGANFGWYASLFAQLVGPGGRVYAFEPVPATFDRLLENLQLNGVSDRVSTVPAALGSAYGEATIHIFEQLSHSLSSLSPLGQRNFTGVKVSVVDLDAYLEQQGRTSIDILKCDVEGSERAVLQGSRRLLRSDRAPIVVVELNDDTSAAFGYCKGDIWELLADAGYDHFYRVESAAAIRPLRGREELLHGDLLIAGKGDRVQTRFAESLRPCRAA